MSKPERKKFPCMVEPNDYIQLEGPDSDGDLSVEIYLADPVSEAIVLTPETAEGLRDYLNRYLEKVQ